MDARKPATHSIDHRDDHFDPIAGPWFEVLDAGDPVPDDPDAVEDEDYVYFQNGAVQPAAPLQEFSFRRGISRLDTRGHIDVAGFSSGDVAFTIPAAYRLPNDQFFTTVLYDGASPIAAMVYFESTTGDVTITYPLV